MSCHSDIPFNATADPCVAQGKIAGLKHRIFLYKALVVVLVIQGPQPPAELRKKNSFQVCVFQNSAGIAPY